MKNKLLQPIDEFKISLDLTRSKYKKKGGYFPKTKKNALMDKVLLKKQSQPEQGGLTPAVQENRYITAGRKAEVIEKDEPLTFHQQLMLDTSIYVNIEEVKREGLRVYRIEDMIPNPYGSTVLNVYDAYLIFKSVSEEEPVRFCKWIGPKATADKKTSSTIWAVGCRALLQVLRTEEYFDGEELFDLTVDYDEENAFPSALKKRIDDVFLRVYQIYGRFNPQSILVAPYMTSLQSENVYIIDGGTQIYVWYGFTASLVERSKAYIIANTIKSGRGGKIQIQLIEEGDETKVFRKLLPMKAESTESLNQGTSSPDLLTQEETDKMATLQIYHSTKNVASMQSLVILNENDWIEAAKQTIGYIIDEETEDLMDCQVKSPLSKKYLKTNQCFVLDSTVELYLWIGEKCNKYHIEEAMECFKACMRSQVRPLWMVVGKVFEGFEPELFRMKFPDWYKRQDVHKIEFKSKQLIQTVSPPLHKTIKDMTYTQITPRKITLVTLECYKVLDDITCVKCKTGLEGFLNLNDSYVFVIVYQIPKPKKQKDESEDDEEEEDDEIYIQLFYWQSRQTSSIKWSKFLMSSGKDLKEFLETQFHTKSSLERVYAFEEPIILQQSLKFNMKYFTAPHDRKKLFKCFIEHSLKSVKMFEVKFEAESLCSRYIYLLLDGQHATLWTGNGASKSENKIAIDAAYDMIRFLDNDAKASSDIGKVLIGKTSLTYLQEKKETDAFWGILKGKKEYGVSNESQANPFPVVLVFDIFKGLIDCTCVDLNVVYTGLPQSILNSEKMVYIDCGVPRPSHLWMGSKVSRQFRNGVFDLLKLRIKDMNDDRQIDDNLTRRLISFSYSQEKLNELNPRSRSSSKNSAITNGNRASTSMTDIDAKMSKLDGTPKMLRPESTLSNMTDKSKSLRPESFLSNSFDKTDKVADKTDKTEAAMQYQVQQYTNATEGQISPYAVQRIENLRNIMNMRKKGGNKGIPITFEEQGKESQQFKSYFICWTELPEYLKKLI